MTTIFTSLRRVFFNTARTLQSETATKLQPATRGTLEQAPRSSAALSGPDFLKQPSPRYRVACFRGVQYLVPTQPQAAALKTEPEIGTWRGTRCNFSDRSVLKGPKSAGMWRGLPCDYSVPQSASTYVTTTPTRVLAEK